MPVRLPDNVDPSDSKLDDPEERARLSRVFDRGLHKPSGMVLPCHAAQTIKHLEFWSVRDRSLQEIWSASPAFEAYRGTGWMKEPCASCERKMIDLGGCRCQALALTGDAANADPACIKSAFHERVKDMAVTEAASRDPGPATYRQYGRAL